MQIISKSKFEQNLFISTFKKGGAKASLKCRAKPIIMDYFSYSSYPFAQLFYTFGYLKRLL